MENELIEKVMQEIAVRLECDNLKKALSDSEYSYGWKMGFKASLAATLNFIYEQMNPKKPKKTEMWCLREIGTHKIRLCGYDTKEELITVAEHTFGDYRNLEPVKLVEE